MATKKNYEIVKEPIGGKGRPKEHKVKVRTSEEDKGKITYKFEKTKYVGIYAKVMYIDGKKDKTVAYRVNLEKGYKKVRNENGEIKPKRIRENKIVPSLAEAKMLKAKEKDYEENKIEDITVHDAWEEYKKVLENRDSEEHRTKYKILDYEIAQKHMESYFGERREIRTISAAEYENFFWDLAKGKKGNNKVVKKTKDGKEEEKILLVGKNSAGKIKCSILQLYKYMDKNESKFRTDISNIQKVSVADIPKTEREKNFEPVVLSVEQINQMLEYAVIECEERDASNLTLLCFGILAGMRKGEILGILWENIEDNLEPNSKIHVIHNRRTIGKDEVIKKPKTGKERYAADVNNVISMCLKIIEHSNKRLRYPEYRDNDEMLGQISLEKDDNIYITCASCNREDGTLPPPKSIWRRFAEFQKRTNKWLERQNKTQIPRMRVHDTRGTFSTRCLMSGEVNFLQVSWALGHSVKLAGMSSTPTTFTNYLVDEGERGDISRYWDKVIDVTPMQAYMDRHGIK